MKTTLHIYFRIIGGHVAGHAQKVIDLPGIPENGVQIESSAFPSGTTMKPLRVVLNVDDRSVFVDLGEFKIRGDQLGVQAFSWAGHNWTLSEELQKESDKYAKESGFSDKHENAS